MPEIESLSKEAKAAIQDIEQAIEVAPMLKFDPTDLGLMIKLAHLLVVERHHLKRPKVAPSVVTPATGKSGKVKPSVLDKNDPVAEARKHPKSPLVPARAQLPVAAAPKSRAKKPARKTAAAPPAPKARSRKR